MKIQSPLAILLTISLAMLLLLGGCGAQTDTPAQTGGIVSAGPSNTEILVALGLGEQIVAADSYSQGIEGLPDEVLFFDMITPDVESLLQLEPELMLISGMTSSQGHDPYKPFADAGIEVVYLPTSESLADIQRDVQAVADLVDRADEGLALVQTMQQELDRVAAIGALIEPEERVRVYFEIQAAPSLYTFGGGVYLDELLTLIGCDNIFPEIDGWTSISEEAVLEADPQVILTTVDYLDDPIAEIMARPGWESVRAVQDGRVYTVDTDRSNRPNHNVVSVLWEIAELVYPERYTR